MIEAPSWSAQFPRKSLLMKLAAKIWLSNSAMLANSIDFVVSMSNQNHVQIIQKVISQRYNLSLLQPKTVNITLSLWEHKIVTQRKFCHWKNQSEMLTNNLWNAQKRTHTHTIIHHDGSKHIYYSMLIHLFIHTCHSTHTAHTYDCSLAYLS